MKSPFSKGGFRGIFESDFQNRFGDLHDLDEIPTLAQLAALDSKLLPAIEQRLSAEAISAETAWLGDLRQRITAASQNARARIAAIKGLALQCDALARMDYDFLFDETRHLLAIGYNVGERRRDSSYYDLLASEARFSSFVAIAQGEIVAGKLVRPGTSAHHRWRRADPPFVERFDVRIPDARSW